MDQQTITWQDQNSEKSLTEKSLICSVHYKSEVSVQNQRENLPQGTSCYVNGALYCEGLLSSP